jgi:hypothetical protein
MDFFQNDPLKIFNKTGTETCKQLFQVNLWCNLIVAVLISVLAVLHIIKIFLISKNFFLKRFVPHTAMCPDEDIIVFQ